MATDSLRKLQLMVFATMFLGYAMYGYNRKSVSLALPKLMEEGLRKEHAGLIVSSQNMAYAISKFIGGVLSDRLSARRLFAIGLVGTGLATLLFGTADSLALFCGFWFLNGFAQGCGWPSCAKIIRQWYPPSQFGTWWSVLSASSNVSGGLAPFLATFIILNYGWRSSLFFAGSLSIAMGLVSFFTLYNSPTDLGYPSFLENAKKNDGEKPEKTDAKKDGGFSDLLPSPFLWLISAAYCVIMATKTSAVDWGQVYLREELGHSAYVGSTLTSCVESGGFFGGIAAGLVTDWAVKRHDRRLRHNPRVPAAIFFFFCTAVCLHILVFVVDQNTSQFLIAVIGFTLGAAVYGDIAIFGIVSCESAPVHLSGSAHAITSFAANVGATLSGLPFSILAAQFSWKSVFLLLEVICGLVCVLMIICVRIDSRIARHLHKD
ncbi:glucose-6-phosphate exchanger SLC37A4 [Galendromus occidentalis]|uniref:Glucose-6-phosphate exchanger SLC37A4 n=1 Tax=Galendromus occidentalis TaxID=34638 RepID=A0AAJ6QPA6_9ACAR|nr:glucose-6-phosphate exchanger SLC37A4 [Galendromus occidentalis]